MSRLPEGSTRVAVVCACLATVGCGKKGPPVAPLVRIPAAVEQITARRVGDDVYVTFTIPSANIDQNTPADVSRVEIYGYTGRTPPPRGRWVDVATLVATVPVAPPPLPVKEGTTAPTPPAAILAQPAQGEQVTIRDTLTADELAQGKIATPEPGTRNAVEPRTANPEPRTGNPEPSVLRRFYLAYPWSNRARVGPPSAVAEVPLIASLDAPPALTIVYTEQQVKLTWEPAGGLIGFLLERRIPDEEVPLDLEDPRAPIEREPDPGPVSYNVYRTTTPAPFVATPPPSSTTPARSKWSEEPDTPLNPTPLPVLEFIDTVEFGQERCYIVRGVHGVGPDARVGAASPPACMLAVDTFAPAPPQALAAVASEGAISLIWEPNAEVDLGGYVVLRGEGPDATLQPLTLTPVTEAGYRDASVKSGMRYVYAVIAIDNRIPLPNMSAPSETVEETAR